MKLGQVSLFAVIGVLLVVGIFAIVVTTNLSDQPSNEQIPESFQPVKTFIESCLRQTSSQAVQLAGSQGGFVQPERFNIIGSYDQSTDNDGIKFSTDSPLTVPYWFYLKSDNKCDGNCQFGSYIPPLSGTQPETVESQISYYVETTLGTCLNGFEVLQEQGFTISPESAPKVKTQIRDQDVRIDLTYPLSIEKAEDVFESKSTSVTLDVPIKQMHDYALAITANQIQHRFLEKQMLSIMNIYAGLDAAKLPPMSASTYEYVPTLFWIKSDVKLKLQEILQTYVGLFQVLSSKNYVATNAPAAGDVTTSVARVLRDSSLPIQMDANYVGEFDVYFDYLDWPYYFDVNSNGEVIKPFSLSVPDFPFFGYQEYITQYDVSYPVRVVIKDDDAFGGQGFTYSFGLESNIRLNEPMEENFTIAANTVRVEDTGTLVCDYDQRNTGDIKITVIDNVTRQPLASAPIQYLCGDDTCSVGVTDLNGQFEGKFPVCGGGLLRISKQDYVDSVTLFTTASAEDKTAQIAVQPIAQLQAAVKKKLIEKGTTGWSYTQREVDLSQNEMAIVSYEQVNPAFGQDPVSGAFVYYANSGPSDLTTMKLVPGLYAVTINTMLLDKVVIPEETRSKRVLFKKIRYTIPEVAFDQYPSGESLFNEDSMFIEVTADDLKKNAVVLYSIASDLPNVPITNRHVEDLSEIRAITDNFANYVSTLMPRFIDETQLPASAGGDNAAFVALSDNSLNPGETFTVKATLLNDIPVSKISVEIDDQTKDVTGIAIYAPISLEAPFEAGTYIVTTRIVYETGVEQIFTQSVRVGLNSEPSSIEVTVNGQSVDTVSLKVDETKPWSIVATYAGQDSLDITQVAQIDLTNADIADYTNDNISGLSIGQTSMVIEYSGLQKEIAVDVTQG